MTPELNRPEEVKVAEEVKVVEEESKAPEEVKCLEFRQFCLEMLRDEIRRINHTIPRLKETKKIYKQLKCKLIMGKRDEDNVIDILCLYPEFFDAYEQFCVHWENQNKKIKEAAAKQKIEDEQKIKDEQENENEKENKTKSS